MRHPLLCAWLLLAGACPADEALPAGALRRMDGKIDTVHALTFSPDGKRLAAASKEADVRVWEVATGKELARCGGHKGGVRALAFSPDGKRLAAGGVDGKLSLWDPVTGKQILTFPGHEGETLSVDFSPDGNRLASGGRDGKVLLWESATGKRVREFQGDGGSVYAVAFSPDGKRLAAGSSDKALRLWESDSGKEILRTGKEPCVSVAFSADGRCLGLFSADKASGSQAQQGCARLQEETAGKEILMIQAWGGGRLPFAFSCAGTSLASGGSDNKIRLWEVATGREVLSLEGQEVSALAFSPEGGCLASGGCDGSVLLWALPTAIPGAPRDLEKLWKDLGAEEAFAAIRELAATPERTLALLEDRVQPAVSDDGLIAKLIADLDSDNYGMREKASRDLGALGTEAEPALRKAMEEPKSAEVRERARVLVEDLQNPPPLPPGEALRKTRCIQLLELIGNPEARKILARLAGGAAGARQTREARLALDRLEGRGK